MQCINDMNIFFLQDLIQYGLLSQYKHNFVVIFRHWAQETEKKCSLHKTPITDSDKMNDVIVKSWYFAAFAYSKKCGL